MKKMKCEEIINELEKIAKEVREDPKIAESSRKLQRESILTEEELRRRIIFLG